MGLGFTMVELLVVVAIVALLAAILFPVFARAKESAKKTDCLAKLRQIGLAFALYWSDDDDQFPDRRDLKVSLGYKPWTSWPASEPRGGWAAVVLDPYVRTAAVWSCDSVAGSAMGEALQVRQDTPVGPVRYWLWRFDRKDDPVPLDDFWGKTPDACVSDMDAATRPPAAPPQGEADIELVVDPYFPKTATTVSPTLVGLSAHAGGRNRVFLDLHATWFRDIRTNY